MVYFNSLFSSSNKIYFWLLSDCRCWVLEACVLPLSVWVSKEVLTRASSCSAFTVFSGYSFTLSRNSSTDLLSSFKSRSLDIISFLCISSMVVSDCCSCVWHLMVSFSSYWLCKVTSGLFTGCRTLVRFYRWPFAWTPHAIHKFI